ncbi:MAG TPA: hypothetical protein VNL38_01030, partial [Candidatus Nitrosotenuis sp.]|nr:hypothetical protein [Candidatus Nitrosotenuis sp.]
MKKTRIAVLAAVAGFVFALALGGQQSATPQQPPVRDQVQRELEQIPTVRAEVTLVNVIFSVLNRRNKFVTDLNRENFKVFED